MSKPVPQLSLGTDEAANDKAVLDALLLKVQTTEGKTILVGQPALDKYTGEDYGWDQIFFIKSLTGVGEEKLAIQMMDGVAYKIQQAGYLPNIAHWQESTSLGMKLMWYFQRGPDPRFSGQIQMPLIAQTALDLAKTYPNLVTQAQLKDWIDSAQINIDWLKANRRAKGETLFSVISTVETGMDSLEAYDDYILDKIPGLLPRQLLTHFSTAYTVPLVYKPLGWNNSRILNNDRSIVIESVAMNVLALREMQALEMLWTKLGESARAFQATQDSAELQMAIDSQLWNEQAGAYFPRGLYPKGEWKQMSRLSVESLFPLMIPSISEDRAWKLIQLILDKFQDKYLLPVSVSQRRNPQIFEGEAGLWWPGQIWANTNWFIRDSLLYHAPRLSEKEKAQALALSKRIDSDWADLKRKVGYREYYLQDGTGGGANHMFWTCLRRTRFKVGMD